MSTVARSNLRAWAQDRRVQVGGVVGLSLAAVLGAGVIATVMNSRADATPPDLAQQSRLTIVTQQAPKPAVVDGGKLATLDPQQTAAVQGDQQDPSLKALVDQERREDQRMAAEQAAFETRMRADTASTSEEDVPPLPEQQPKPAPSARGGWTSNAEDTPG